MEMRPTFFKYYLLGYSYKSVRRSLYNAAALQTADIDLHQDVAVPRNNDTQIVIIGAGIAGLSAANHLIKNGFDRTLVLEATDRYGGRINSKRFGDTFCELGAKWVSIDGSHDSTYKLLCSATGLEKQIKQPEDIAYVHTEGLEINPNTAELIDTLFRRLCCNFKISDKVKSGSNLYELDNVMAYFRGESNKLLKTFTPAEQQIASDVFESLFKEFSSILGCCLEKVNIEHISQLTTPLKDDMRPIYIPTGLDNIIQCITSNITAEHMQMGKPVGKIQWQTINDLSANLGLAGTANNLVTEPKFVGCVDGSVYRADHIICTLPLGVLKNFSNILFKPALPKEKLDAINNLGFGNPVKIYLEYKRPINNWLKVNIRPLGSSSKLAKTIAARETQKIKSTERAWTQQVVEITKVPYSNRVLEVQVGGGYYDEIEKLPDAKLLEEITELLRLCLANENIPYPSSLLRSNWSSSACYLGGRPYFAIGSSIMDVQRLAMPLSSRSAPTLLFAGDATILHGFGTIDGARASGIREAQRIIDYYRRGTTGSLA